MLASWKSLRKHLPALTLAGIFIIAFAVRAYGINFGFPYAEEIDEPAIMDHVVEMVRSSDWSPHWFNYGAFYVYAQVAVTYLYVAWGQLQGTLSSIQQLGGVEYPLNWIPRPDLYLWGRMLSVLIGSATVLVVYKAGRELYSRAVGLVAAAILALTFLHSQYSHFIRTDIPLTFFAPLTLLFSIGILRSGRIRDYVLAGIGVGLTVASKYNGVPIALVVIAAHFARLSQSSGPNRWRFLYNPRTYAPLVLAGVVSVIAFFATCPTAPFEWDAFQAGLDNGTVTFSYAGFQLDNISYYLGYLMFRGGLGDLLTALAIGGVLFALIRHTRIDLIAVIFPLVYFFMILFGVKTHIRMALPLTPFLALFAALALVTLVKWASGRVKRLAPLQVPLIAVLTIALLIVPAQKILADDTSMATPTTRAIATEWARANLPAGVRVLSEANGIYVQSPQVNVPLAAEENPTLERLQSDNVDYFISANYPPTRPQNWPNLTLIKTFEPGTNPGPLIRILKVPPLPLPLELVDAKFDRERLAPGEQAQVTLHWRASNTIQDNHTEFVRLTGSDGTIAFELAEAPQQGIGKMKKWPVSQVITDTHILPFPQDLEFGIYQVQVGFYRAGSEYALALRGPNAEPVRALGTGSLVVAPRLPPAGQPETRMDVRFDDQLRLNGYTIAPKSIAPGQSLDLKLFWSAPTVPTVSYTRFVHLLDAQNKLVAQEDTIPFNGSYPTTLWEANAVIEDAARLTLPADLQPGTYTLQVGWYDAANGQRLRTAEGDDAVVLERIVIGK